MTSATIVSAPPRPPAPTPASLLQLAAALEASAARMLQEAAALRDAATRKLARSVGLEARVRRAS